MKNTYFDSGVSIDFYFEERTQTIPRIKKQKSFVIPSKQSGELVARIMLILTIFSILPIFMEFPSLHPGKTYIQKNGEWKEITKPIIHAPFNFKGRHVSYNSSLHP